MDTAFTYTTPSWERVSVYAPPGLEPPDDIEMLRDNGEIVTAVRISDSSLVCEPIMKMDAKGKFKETKCSSAFECHRRELGVCQCGMHPPVNNSRIPLSRAKRG